MIEQSYKFVLSDLILIQGNYLPWVKRQLIRKGNLIAPISVIIL